MFLWLLPWVLWRSMLTMVKVTIYLTKEWAEYFIYCKLVYQQFKLIASTSNGRGLHYKQEPINFYYSFIEPTEIIHSVWPVFYLNSFWLLWEMLAFIARIIFLLSVVRLLFNGVFGIKSLLSIAYLLFSITEYCLPMQVSFAIDSVKTSLTFQLLSFTALLQHTAHSSNLGTESFA